MNRRMMQRGCGLAAALVVAGPLAMVGTAVAPAGAGTMPGRNGVIACQTNRTGDNEIFTFDPSGTEVGATNLTNSPTTQEARPRFSSDGRKIAFERSGNIWVMDANGANPRQVTTLGGSAASFSPGNDQLVFQSSRSGNFAIYKINLDGTGEVKLTNNPTEDSLPQWSPDGLKIAYSSRSVDPDADVMIMNTDGTGVVDVTNSPREDSWPSWSPDGKMLAFHSRLVDQAGEEIYRINIDGTNRVQLTNNPNAFDIFPAWSPDGTRIVFNSDRLGSGFGEIWTISAVDGSNLIRITNNAATDQRCDWQPLCTIYGSGTIYGTDGDDIICGSDGSDNIFGMGGNDRIIANAGSDMVHGGDGNDTIFGGAGSDQLFGDAGDDVIHGNTGDDRLFGNDGNDRLYGGDGSDFILGGAGTDFVDGGPGPNSTCQGTTVVNCP